MSGAELTNSTAENVPSIQSLGSRVLHSAVDWWNTAIIVALVVAAIAAVAVGGTSPGERSVAVTRVAQVIARIGCLFGNTEIDPLY
jgi:hypothetical protein